MINSTPHRIGPTGASNTKVIAITLVSTLALLALAGGLGLYARKVKEDSDRAGCIMNIRNMQVALRSYQGMYDVKPYPTTAQWGGTIPTDEMIGPGKFIEVVPVCPGGGEYNIPGPHEGFATPPMGTAYMRCSLEHSHDHKPEDTSGW